MPTTSGLPYSLRLPVDGDIADVPADLGHIAEDLTTVLNTKLQRADLTLPGGTVVEGADKLYQTKIEFFTGPGLPAVGSYDEGDIIFVVP